MFLQSTSHFYIFEMASSFFMHFLKLLKGEIHMKSLVRILMISSFALIQCNILFAQWTSGTVPQWTQVDTLKTDHILSIAVAPNGYI